ncbi:MAG TPA: alpha/beta fold hydrolase [Microbacterium sp.]|uniref:alpha/beta fold hydrolase n=1 Tax=Microbacterium sp. TaxID=51671 RepID=UPI002B49A584|nr:alpha/beta fold hydrolase [Microbacterium sp.]HKT57769.1 alpha/beta fold hydrolase [Microbacterium sp.]
MSTTRTTDDVTSVLTPRLTTSADGTPIEYFSIGTGPGIVIVHGTMQSAASQSELAGLLADGFAVHLVNRRGRGRSGAYPALAEYDPAIEVDDIDAVVRATGSVAALGISSGGILVADLGLRRPELTLALFEPALVADGSLDLDGFLARFEPEVERGDVPAYMVTALLGTQMGPGFLRLFPRRMLESSTRSMLAKAAGPLPAGGATMAELAANVPYDMRIVASRADRIDEYAALAGRVLLITAAKSPAYLRHAVARLAELLPDAPVAVVERAGHSATQNRTDGGRPADVAEAIRRGLGA